MSTFNLEIVTPTQILESVNVSYARCPGVDGLFGIMSGHREAIIALDLGEIKITSDNKDAYYSTSGGFVEITKDKINLLVETIEKSTDIDLSLIHI